jgi:predicted restriction endonuclease
LQRVVEPLLRPTDADDNDAFDPTNQKDAREKVLREIKARRGQRSFRDALIDAYDGRCAITGCDVLDVLEAANITPYLGPATNHITNGLLLRADVHTLFDMGLIAVDPKTKDVLVAPSIKDPIYRGLHGKPLRPTKLGTSVPSDKAIRQHRSDCGW